jgi:antiphage defense system Thoeris ThsB-like protein
MAYRNKTFVSFASEDIHFYRLMCAWRVNKRIEFDFYDAHDINVARDSSQADTINRRLRERLGNTKQVVMLIGDVTRRKAANPNSFVYYEARTILRLGLPVIFANVNRSRVAQPGRIPEVLLDPYTISTSFGPTILKYALDEFPDDYAANSRLPEYKQKKGTYQYNQYVYEGLGLGL